MYILFDEEAVLRELARRGFQGLKNEKPALGGQVPMTGWECKTCGHIMKVAKTGDGTCNVCLSPLLNPIFGIDNYLEKYNARKRQIAAIRKKQTRY